MSPIRSHALARRRQLVALSQPRFYGPGGYEGARTDRAATRNWTPAELSPDGATVPDLPGLRARIRDLVRNAPLVAGALDTHLFSTVGAGLIPHPRVDRELLGLTDAHADAIQKKLARIFWAWSATCDIRRQRNFGQMTWSAYRGWWDGGETFVRRRFKERPGDLLGLKLQLIEPERICTPDGRLDTDQLTDGIEHDADGATVQFHVLDRHPGDGIWPKKWITQPAFGPESGERMMLHIALLDRDGQTRGVSRLAPVVEAVKGLTRYASAELDTAVALSFIMAVLTTEDGGMGLGSMGVGNNQPIVGFQGGPASASADRQIELAPAAVAHLASGEKLESFNPQRPNSAFEPFFRVFCSIIGSAAQLPHELLIKHFTSSYSASRGALIEAWRGFRTNRQMIVVDQFAQPVYEWMVAESVSREYLDAPGFFDDPLIRQAYCGCSWAGPTMGQLNPGDEIGAAEKRVGLGITTLEQETAEYDGGDWEEKHHQRVKEQKMRTADGLAPVATPAASQSGGAAAPVGGAPAQDAKDAAETAEMELAHA